MKRIVRSFFKARMVQLGLYSRDIAPCAKIASQQFPQIAPALWKAAELAIYPSDDEGEIMALLSVVSPPLLALQKELAVEAS